MPRWTTLVIAAAALAAPVSTHYAGTKEPATPAVLSVPSGAAGQQVSPGGTHRNATSRSNPTPPAPSSTPASMLKILQQGKTDVKAEGLEAIGDLMCDYTHGAKGEDGHCPADPVKGPLTGSEEKRGVHLLLELKDIPEKNRQILLRRMGDEEFVALLYLGYIRMVLI